jgi:hypothetical protein
MALGRHYSRDSTWWDSQWQHYQRVLRITLTLTAVLLTVAIILAWRHV